MRIIEPYARIIGLADRIAGVALLRQVEWAGRVSHRSEEAQTHDSYDRFLRHVVLQHGDWSITEHASVTVDATVDRGITHEWVRHRLGAYTQESTRFVNYEKKMPPSFVYPEVGVRCDLCLAGNPAFNEGSGVFRHDALGIVSDCAYKLDWLLGIARCELAYQRLIASGQSPQVARSVFPNALASRLIVTYNLRNWRHFFLMRTSKEAHPQMRQVTVPLLREFQQKIPILYDDLEPERRQVENLRMGR